MGPDQPALSIPRGRVPAGSLTGFGTITFTGTQAAAGGVNALIPSFTASGGPLEIVMVNNSGTTKAQPSGLDATGVQFSDAWKHS
jgi:hypothetical protein